LLRQTYKKIRWGHEPGFFKKTNVEAIVRNLAMGQEVLGLPPIKDNSDLALMCNHPLLTMKEE